MSNKIIDIPMAIKIVDAAQPVYGTKSIAHIFNTMRIGSVVHSEYSLGNSTRDYDYASRPVSYSVFMEHMYDNAFTQQLIERLQSGKPYTFGFRDEFGDCGSFTIEPLNK